MVEVADASVRRSERTSRPGAVFVIDDGDNLLGYISYRSLDLLKLVLPERLRLSLRERGARRASRSVSPDASFEDALALTMRTEQTAIVDYCDGGLLLGYLKLFAMLAHVVPSD
jgi:hypothetical protein